MLGYGHEISDEYEPKAKDESLSSVLLLVSERRKSEARRESNKRSS